MKLVHASGDAAIEAEVHTLRAQRVRAIADGVEHELRFALFPPIGIDGIAEVVARSCPVELRAQIALALLAVWTRLVDGATADVDVLAARVERYGALVRYGHCAKLVFDPAARVLSRVLEVLSATPLATRLWVQLVTQLEASLEALVWERYVAHAHVEYVDDTYLEHAARTTNVHAVATAAMLLLDDRDALAHLDMVLVAQDRAARTIRLAHDRALRRRERSDSSALRGAMRAELEAMRALLHQLPPTLPTRAMLDRFTADFVVRYEVGDL